MTTTMGSHPKQGIGPGNLHRGKGRKWAGWLLIAYLVPLAVLVLSIRLTDIGLPQLADSLLGWAAGLDLVPGLRFGHIEALANIAIFFPIGFLLTGLFGRRPSTGQLTQRRRPAGLPDWSIWLVATAMSAGIEMTQLFLLTERSATLRDLICNSAGALAGVLTYRVISIYRHRIRRKDRP